jgi:hypothetical protein
VISASVAGRAVERARAPRGFRQDGCAASRAPRQRGDNGVQNERSNATIAHHALIRLLRLSMVGPKWMPLSLDEKTTV